VEKAAKCFTNEATKPRKERTKGPLRFHVVREYRMPTKDEAERILRALIRLLQEDLKK